MPDLSHVFLFKQKHTRGEKGYGFLSYVLIIDSNMINEIEIC